ncbi:unnamed protein product, partial [Gongylonema pulchrum]|uniref:Myosin_tail_1 domain-containing protein n=1 Tax=Gongylonema pulchrum TaxID=637853 RepID=A0A183DKE6_9BILA
MEQTVRELKAADEVNKKACADASRLAEELRQEREHEQYLQRRHKDLEFNLKVVQAKLEEAEATVRK